MRTYVIAPTEGIHYEPSLDPVLAGQPATLEELRERLPVRRGTILREEDNQRVLALRPLLTELAAGRDGSGAFMDAEAILGITVDPEIPEPVADLER